MLYENKISAEDISIMKNYIEDYGHGNSSAVPAILEAWYANKDKGNLFHLFGEDLILSKEVELEASKHQKVEEIALIKDKYWHHMYTLQRFFNEHSEREHITVPRHLYFVPSTAEANVWEEV